MVRKKKADKCGCSIQMSDCGKRSTCGGIYGLGFLGAVIYYISTASGFWMGALGILKALVWPAFLVFEVLKFLGA